MNKLIQFNFCGVVCRVFGIRMGTLIFSTIVTIGHFVFAFGALINEFWTMQLGRFIFGSVAWVVWQLLVVWRLSVVWRLLVVIGSVVVIGSY